MRKPYFFHYSVSAVADENIIWVYTHTRTHAQISIHKHTQAHGQGPRLWKFRPFIYNVRKVSGCDPVRLPVPRFFPSGHKFPGKPPPQQPGTGRDRDTHDTIRPRFANALETELFLTTTAIYLDRLQSVWNLHNLMNESLEFCL